MASRQVHVSPVEYVSDVREGEHGVMFYTSLEDRGRFISLSSNQGLRITGELYIPLLHHILKTSEKGWKITV